ncbi:hypothetical protein BDZ89DRAFT_1098721 [Hymenopellis radicata]|nr:hypothetical protein BDZ89DRAFT_1098721 [Hymenopellis radicata]
MSDLRRSSRASYPTFLSLYDTLILQSTSAWRGILDGLRVDLVIAAVARDSEIQANVLKSMLLNSLSLASIYTFDLLLQPLVRDQRTWHRNVGWFYQIFWVMPVVSVSLYLNSSWCNLIARRIYTLQHGSRALSQTQPTTYRGILTTFATSAYRAIMVVTSVLVSFIMRYIPYVGGAMAFIYLCWVDSYYFFEFIWVARGYSLSRRIRCLEERWVYFLAFGIPSACICNFGSGLANAAIFALVFPAFTIMAIHANPVPADPYNPATHQSEDTILHPSPFVPIRLPIFTPVLLLNDMIVKVLSVSGGSVSRHTRVPSDASEYAEEGVVQPSTSPKKRFNPKVRKTD